MTGEGRPAFSFRPIGVVHSPFREPSDIPREWNRRPGAFDDVAGELEIFPEFAEGLDGLEPGAGLIVLFVFHKAGYAHLRVTPPGETRERGVFASRSPHRPNSIGMTVVRLKAREGTVLKVAGLDMVEGTPILDVKPA
jgi:tRNA-Thr(GGU) m(6)t(6)A37 methyltransferase TsaA